MKKATRVFAIFLGLVTIAALEADSASAQAPRVVGAAYSVSAASVSAAPNTESDPSAVDSLVSFAAPDDSSMFDTWQFQRHLISELGLTESPSILVTLKRQIMNPQLPGGMSMTAGSTNGLRNIRQYRMLDHMMPGLMDEARTYHVTVGVRF